MMGEKHLSPDSQILRIALEYAEGKVRTVRYFDFTKRTGNPAYEYLSVNRVFNEKFGENISYYYPSEALVLAKKLSNAIMELKRNKKESQLPVIVGVEIDGFTYNFLNDEIFEVMSPIINKSDNPTSGIIYSSENLEIPKLVADSKEKVVEVEIENLHKLK